MRHGAPAAATRRRAVAVHRRRRPSPPLGAAVCLALLAVALVLPACAGPAGEGGADDEALAAIRAATGERKAAEVNPHPGRPEGPAPGLTNTFPTVEALAEEFLRGLERGNFEGLLDLGLTREEFAWYVWPELPSSQAERNLTVDFVWDDLNGKSRRSLARTVARHGGRRYTLERVDFDGRTTEYRTFSVHRDARVWVEDTEGREGQLDLFGSVMEIGGQFKLFSFVTD